MNADNPMARAAAAGEAQGKADAEAYAAQRRSTQRRRWERVEADGLESSLRYLRHCYADEALAYAEAYAAAYRETEQQEGGVRHRHRLWG